MTQYVEVDEFDNVTGYIEAAEPPERPGRHYEVQTPPVSAFPAPPFQQAILRRTAGVTYWHDPRSLGERIEAASADVVAQLAAQDEMLVRPLGELTEALATAASVPAVALARVQAIHATKAAMRGRLAAIQACATLEDLAALLASPIEP